MHPFLTLETSLLKVGGSFEIRWTIWLAGYASLFRRNGAHSGPIFDWTSLSVSQRICIKQSRYNQPRRMHVTTRQSFSTANNIATRRSKTTKHQNKQARRLVQNTT